MIDHEGKRITEFVSFSQKKSEILDSLAIMKAVFKSLQEQQKLAQKQSRQIAQISTLFCSLASLDYKQHDDSSSSSSMEFK